jgi:predicted DCC family thiol-disulfide oxidoreductase YuxK
MNATPIVVFDGECALCNGFVAWLIRHDKRAVFKIAGSAGEVGKAIVAAAGLEGTVIQSTIVVWDGQRGLTRSDAVLAIVTRLGWPWRALGAARVLPRAWRDAAYGAVAKRRARLEAEDAACGVPPAELVAEWRSRLATAADVPVNEKTSP